MGPGLGIDLALGFCLDPIVANRRGGIQRVGDVRIGQWLQVFGIKRVRGPYARITVGLPPPMATPRPPIPRPG